MHGLPRPLLLINGLILVVIIAIVFINRDKVPLPFFSHPSPTPTYLPGVPTPTPTPKSGIFDFLRPDTPTPSPSPTPSGEPTPTNEPPTPDPTTGLIPTLTPTPTGQPNQDPTTSENTPTPTSSNEVPTATPVPVPTATPVPGATNTPAPTDAPTVTDIPPTAANTPVPPTATNTPVPPTSTPTPTPTTAPGSNYSIRFYGYGDSDVDRIKVSIDNPAKPIDVSGDFTFEFFMKANDVDNSAGNCQSGTFNWIYGNIMFDRDVYGAGDNGDFGISMYTNGIAFGIGNSYSDETLCSSASVDDGNWHHVAVTRANTGQMRIFIDGQSSGQVTGPSGDVSYRDGRSTSYPNSDPYLVMGAEKHDAGLAYPSYNGLIDEVRVSNTIRYTSNFTPPSSAFTSDGNTVALYHFNDGTGDCTTGTNITDSSGGGSTGVCRYGGSPTAGPKFTTDIPF